MIRTLDATFFNAVINNPDVRPWLGGSGELDVTPTVANPANYALQFDGGGFIVVNLGGGEYECHSQFLPAHRGDTVNAMRAAMAYMFTATDCQRIVTKLPANNAAAKALGRHAGFVTMFRREGAWSTPDGPVAVDHAAVCIDRWAQRDDDNLSEGQAFHDALEAAKVAAGSVLVVHEDDDAHDRAAGAAMRMVKAGNPIKAVWFYNRWAALAGYQQIAVVSVSPPVIDIQDAVLELRGGRMEVLLCR